MAEARSNTQLPLGANLGKSIVDEEIEAFKDGIEIGRQYADVAVRRIGAWAEENPGQVLLAGLVAGFLIGKIFIRKPKRIDLSNLDLDDL